MDEMGHGRIFYGYRQEIRILSQIIFVLYLGRNFDERQSIQDKQNEQPHQAYNLKDIIYFGCGIYRHKD